MENVINLRPLDQVSVNAVCDRPTIHNTHYTRTSHITKSHSKWSNGKLNIIENSILFNDMMADGPLSIDHYNSFSI